MYPVDGSSPTDFDGIDYTAYFRGSTVYDSQVITERVLDLVGGYLNEKGFAARRCFQPGMGAAATGAPAFIEALLWIKEHWEFLAGAATVVFAQVAKVGHKWRQLKRHIDERILDPHKPSFVIELGVRISGGEDSRKEAARSFRSVLLHVPEINSLLRSELPDQNCTIRVLTAGASPEFAYAYFKVAVVRRSDVAKMIRYLDKKKNQDGLRAVLLYRRFGFLTRFETSESDSDFMRLTSR